MRKTLLVNRCQKGSTVRAIHVGEKIDFVNLIGSDWFQIGRCLYELDHERQLLDECDLLTFGPANPCRNNSWRAFASYNVMHKFPKQLAATVAV